MEFSFTNANRSAFGAGGPLGGSSGNAQNGPDLEDIQTEVSQRIRASLTP